jgi:hypothetical protein
MRHLTLFATVLLLASLGVEVASGYPLTLEQRQRLRKYVPRSFAKMEARDPMYVVALGDGVMGGFNPIAKPEDQLNPLYGYVGSFLQEVAREFFYTGGTRLVNPPPNGANKLAEYFGSELQLENVTEPEGTMLTGLRRATTDAFLHDPDLILVQYGVFDSIRRVPLEAHKRALQEIIDAARVSKCDIIVIGPTMVNYGGGAMEWGLERPYAVAASEVAARNGVLYLDAGRHLAKFGGGIDPDTEAAAASEILSDRLRSLFEFGPDLTTRERVHLAPRAHESLGLALFRELLDGSPGSEFTIEGISTLNGSGNVGVTLSLRNQGKDEKKGSIGALSASPGLQAVDPSKRFRVAAGNTTELVFAYQRPTVGETRDNGPLLFPFEPGDVTFPVTLILEDTFSSELIQVPLRTGPVMPVWRSTQTLNVDKSLRLNWDLVNGTDRSISGTFTVGFGKSIGKAASFSVSPLGTKSVDTVFDFEPPASTQQFQRDVWIEIEAEGIVVRFLRELEATHDVVLGEELAMPSWETYANAPPAGIESALRRPVGSASVRFDADADALYMVATLTDFPIPDLGDRAALQARLFLDARPGGEVRSFGVVEPVEIYTRGTDGPGFTPALPLGVFGNGYNLVLNPTGVTSVLTTATDGNRQLEVRVPRSYLHRHEWLLNAPEAMLGMRLELTVADADALAPDPFPASKRFVTHSPTFAWKGQTIYGVYERDARSLTTLRLSRQPVRSWSVRVY